MFDFFICEGKSPQENYILLEIQPELLLRTLKSSPNIKMARIKLTKRQTPCLTVELDLHSATSRANSRTITHDIPVKIISSTKVILDEFQEPDISRTTLSIQLPPVKLLKHMIERMKCLSEFVYLEATSRGALTLKVETDCVSVCTYFKGLQNLPVPKKQQQQSNENQDEYGDEEVGMEAAEGERQQRENNKARTNQQSTAVAAAKNCTVRLSLKKLHEFINALQFQPTKLICNFLDQKYAHFFVVHEDDIVLQYLISSVLS